MKKLMLIFVSCFSLIACSQNLSAPMEAAVTPTFTPWMAGTQTALAVASQVPFEATQVVIEKPTDFSPVLFGKKYDKTAFLLLGGVSRDAWLAPDVSVMRFGGEATYSLHTLTQEYKYYFWGKAPESSPTCNTFFIGTDADPDEVGTVAVLDGWSITKRITTELPADGQFYQQMALNWLAAEGVTEPQLGALQIFRVDLEGDGTDEIFISATHLDESQHTTKAGDYSIVLMRKVVGNDAVTIPLVADFYISEQLETTFPRTYSIANFIDLNQDGILEVVVGIQKWEGFGAIVYQINNQNVTEALHAEC
jgi:hypothetical protein